MTVMQYFGWKVDVKNLDVYIPDHFGGFSESLNNDLLDFLSDEKLTVYTEYIFDQQIKDRYKNFNFVFSLDMWITGNFIDQLKTFKPDPTQKKLKNFICSFNGAPSVSRQFLTNALYKFRWIEPEYFSKNFITSRAQVDGNILQFSQNPDQEQFYRKFIIHDNNNFYDLILSHHYEPTDHAQNIGVLHGKIKDSFLQIIGETIGTSFYPFVTEKIFYPILSKTFWLAYAQPRYHEYVEKYFGFKPYKKIFDYSFDQIENPIIRLVELLTMVSKFEKLTELEWSDLYLQEQDTILYNYNHYISGDYLKFLSRVQ